MKKALQYLGVTLGFVTIFAFAFGQLVVWDNYGFVWGILMWIPFITVMWLIGKVFPFD